MDSPDPASPLRSVCVFCGSRDGARPVYAHAAEETGAMLARNGWQLVYGAGDVGLMGRVASAAQAGNGRTLGVIPEHLMAREVGKRDLDTLIVTETMHERKKVMILNAQAIVLLPGGAGSLDEFFESITWRQLGLIDTPVLLLDVGDYWAPLLALVDHIVAEGFADHSLSGLFRRFSDVTALEAGLHEVLAK